MIENAIWDDWERKKWLESEYCQCNQKQSKSEIRTMNYSPKNLQLVHVNLQILILPPAGATGCKLQEVAKCPNVQL